MKNEKFEIIAKTFQGLEDVLAQEVTVLGGEDVEIGKRMVSFKGDKEMLYKANLYCRTALRILKPIFTFTASDTDEVYEKIKSFDWDQYLSPEQTFSIESVVFSEEFKHSKFVTYRVKDAIADYFSEKTGKRPSVRLNNADIMLNLHIAHNFCTLSLDSSGESLHKRGYRVSQTEAPINEVLAAGLILKTGWQGDKNLIDPMCGSGTILIEAAMIATNTAPGIYRKDFAFERWNDYDEELFDRLYNDDSNEKEFDFKIYGSDISPKAIAIAQENIKSAGMSKYIDLQVKPFQQYTEVPEKGLLISNPPYGERISSKDLLGLYEMIGTQLKYVFKGYDAWIISYHDECFDKIGLKPAVCMEMMNGSLECEFRKYEIFEGKYNDFKRETGGFREKKREDKPMEFKKREYKFDNRKSEKLEKRPFRKEKESFEKRENRFGKRKTQFEKPAEAKEERRSGQTPEWHGEEAVKKYVTFRQPKIGASPTEDNRPGWKKLRDKNIVRKEKGQIKKSRKRENPEE